MNKRLLWLDIAKGVAILLVVLGHCMDSTTPLRAFIYSFHMPLFFVLAGFTMRAKPRGEVLHSSLRRLALPYLVVCGILFLFAFFPPSSFSPSLDSQYSPLVVLKEILYGSGSPGTFFSVGFEAIGAIWFLPCLFFARLMLNEILLWCNNRPVWTEPVAVILVVALGFSIGNSWHLPLDIDTAMVSVGFMYVGYRAKLFDLKRIPWPAWLALFAVWMLYPYAGNNEMAVRAYLDYPFSIFTAAAGSLVVMRLCMYAQKVPVLSKGLAWCGVSSLLILCVHRVESAIFNWQTIMETVRPDVWDWGLTLQGVYQFSMRFALVIVTSFLLQQTFRWFLRHRPAYRSRLMSSGRGMSGGHPAN